MEDLMDGIVTSYCDGCDAPIVSKREVRCVLNDNAKFCSEECEQEYETKTRDLWLQGEQNERAIFSTSNC